MGIADKPASSASCIGAQINRQEKRRRFIGPITDSGSALDAAKMGAFAGIVWLLLSAIGASTLVLLLLRPDITAMEQNLLMPPLIGAVLSLLLIGFLTWRVFTGKGYISSVVLLVLFVASLVMTGLRGFIWWGLYFAMFAAFANGIRGTWAMRRYRRKTAGLDPKAFE
jgi:hypothetical protein